MKIRLYRLFKLSITAFGTAIIILIFIASLARTSGRSMQPTYWDGDLVLVSKISHTFNRIPDYGDVVAIDSRTYRSRSITDDFMEIIKTMIANIKGDEPPKKIWLKRVIGLPGDTIEFPDGSHVYRNGELLEESYIFEPMQYQNSHKYIVPENAVFVLGDNRNHSTDSRYIGFVPGDHVVGIIIGKIW
jgi:signal peptidase I